MIRAARRLLTVWTIWLVVVWPLLAFLVRLAAIFAGPEPAKIVTMDWAWFVAAILVLIADKSPRTHGPE